MFDVPLVCVTLAAFIWHFNGWATHGEIDTTINVASRLSTARWRVTALFVGILLLCWWLNFAVWSLFAALLAIGVAVAFLTGGDIDSGAFGLLAAA